MTLKWYSEPISFFDSDKKSYDYTEITTIGDSNLSPLTDFILNVLAELQYDNNYIISIPQVNFNTSPLIAYHYMKHNDKSVIIIPNEGVSGIHQPSELLRRNYYLLAVERGRLYLFERFPCGIITDEGVDINPYVPRANNVIKEQYKTKIINQFKKENLPRLLIAKSHNRTTLSGIISKLITDSDNEVVDVSSSVGLIIFENVDRYIYSEASKNSFLRWIQPFIELGAKVILHFSNCNNRFIDIITKSTNSILIHLGLPLIQSNRQVINEWNQYENNKLMHRKIQKELEKFNWDSNQIYKDKTVAFIWSEIPEDGIDYHFYNCIDLFNSINQSNIVFDHQFSYIHRLVYSLHHISIDPTWYKQRFIKNNGDFRSINIPAILDEFSSSHILNKHQDEYLVERLISEIRCIYSNLENRVSNINQGYYNTSSKIGNIKQYLENYIDSRPLIICTNSSYEKNWLQMVINDDGYDNVKVMNIDFLVKANVDRRNYNILFTGYIRKMHIYELLRPYHIINFLTYSGYEKRLIEEAISLVTHSDLALEKKSIDSIRAIWNRTQRTTKDPIVIDFEARLHEEDSEIDKPTLPKKEIDSEDQKVQEKVLLDINDIIGKVAPNLDNNSNQHDSIEKEIQNKETEMETEYDIITLQGINISTGEECTLKLIPSNIYIYIASDSDLTIIEGYPENLQKDNLLILPDNDIRSSFIDIILKIKGSDELIDKHLIEEWHVELRKFLKHYDFSAGLFHRMYQYFGGDKTKYTIRQWIKGEVIGPRDIKDLKIIGKIINDKDLLENVEMIYSEMEKWRNYRRIAGMKISKVIQNVIAGELDPTSLDFESSIIVEMVEKSIYRLV